MRGRPVLLLCASVLLFFLAPRLPRFLHLATAEHLATIEQELGARVASLDAVQASMEADLAKVLSGQSDRPGENASSGSCLNRLLKHKRLGALDELMFDGGLPASTDAQAPGCAPLLSAGAWGSQLCVAPRYHAPRALTHLTCA